jgi:hypothetical protein
MKNDNRPSTHDATEPVHTHVPSKRVHKSVRKWQRFEASYPNAVLRSMTADQKVQQCRQSVCNALMQVAIESGRGQPPKVERLLAATNIVDELVLSGVPLGIGRNSRMNKELRIRLHEEELRSADDRNSRPNLISADAVRLMLRQIRWMRICSDHFTKMFPYTE